ncbi:hypothetical protein Vadar_031081 [Vaccinium darrowii]|nr:hypothetical protein Vadar_031081 [Vaccinium darrowii]
MCSQRAPASDSGDRRRIERPKISCKMMLFNSFRELEGKYIDYLSFLMEKKIIPTGPLVQEITDGDEDQEILQWLGTKDELSTVFVSFGNFQLERELRLKTHFLWSFLRGQEKEEWL